jgi:hypothetical protein
MDLLYVLGSGSKFNNDELRYSLRSVERYVKNVDRIIVIGEDPKFISDKVEYHYVKEHTSNKEYRIAYKILKACELGIVNGDFLFMNDDFFFTKEVDANTYPYYHKGCLSLGSPSKFYKAALNATYAYLYGHEQTTLHFDVHTPIIYNSKRFLALKPHLERSKVNPFGFVVKSLYSNFEGIKGEEYVDSKLGRYNINTNDRINKTSIISCTDTAFEEWLYDYLKENFKEKSIYEAH